jgi:EAL domain-containing protein (putative c-di-GMP-specific phosphodiesterase class I)
VHDFIQSAKKMGCKIAIDDFGTGYSNFQNIIELSEYIDYVKIDGSLVKHITTNQKVVILIKSLKYLCDKLDIKLIAEYVENEEIFRFLVDFGIEYSQGYHIGKPSPSI